MRTDLDVQALEQARYRRLFWLLLAAVTLLRLSVAGLFGLSTDESHYVLYARHPAWGYFDHPPMVAFLASLTTLWSEHVFFVRLGPILCSFLSTVLLRTLAVEMLGSEKRAFWAVVWLIVMPVHHLLGVALMPDSTLNVFWCGALLAAWRAFRDGKWSLWIMMGLFFGGALMSKYHGALFPLCLAGYALTSRETRRWLWSPRPYVAGLVGLLVFLPNIAWNYRHDWISYAFQLQHGGGGGEFEWSNLFSTLGGQLAAASPVLFVLFAVAVVAALRSRPLSDARRFALWTSVPVFVLFGAMGLTGKVLPHWTAVGWWGGSILLADVVGQKITAGGRSAVRWRRASLAAGALGAVMILLVHVAMVYPVVEPLYEGIRPASIWLSGRFPRIPALPPYRSALDLSNDMYGWDQAAGRIELIRATLPDPARTFVCSDRFFTISQLGPQLGRGTEIAAIQRRPSQYRIWFDPAQHEGWDALFVDDERWLQGPGACRRLFMMVDTEPTRVVVKRAGRDVHVLNVYRCFGYRGGKEVAP